MWKFACKQACVLVGVLCPALASAKAAVQEDAEGYEQWMAYWVVATLLVAVEAVTDVVVAPWLPLYHELKVALLLWLTLPRYQGAAQLYRAFVHPTLAKYEGAIDTHLSSAQEKVGGHVRRVTAQAAGELARAVREQGGAGLSVGLSTLASLTSAASSVALSSLLSAESLSTASAATAAAAAEHDGSPPLQRAPSRSPRAARALSPAASPHGSAQQVPHEPVQQQQHHHHHHHQQQRQQRDRSAGRAAPSERDVRHASSGGEWEFAEAVDEPELDRRR
eukprot:TRINITY_DN13186_c1_g1_i1.p1 TRINITY_DN13186_c1_g1~~TRINITY_DN13186_c1_g1_i1.p1  ORF type:complete len:278 (-),score=115.80 TRINITY_DN13186_c1_g1_i1:863-1696(-)